MVEPWQGHFSGRARTADPVVALIDCNGDAMLREGDSSSKAVGSGADDVGRTQRHWVSSQLLQKQQQGLTQRSHRGAEFRRVASELRDPLYTNGLLAQPNCAGFTERLAREHFAHELFAVDGDGIFQQLACGFSGGGRQPGKLQ